MPSSKDFDPISTGICPDSEVVSIELTGVLREDGRIYAVFRAGPSERILAVNENDLDDFALFRQRVVKELSIEVRHPCQSERTPRKRRSAWRQSVEQALARGT